MWARRQDLNIDRVTREREIEIWVLYERRQVGGASMAGCAASARGWMSSGIRAEAGSRRSTREKKTRGEASVWAGRVVCVAGAERVRRVHDRMRSSCGCCSVENVSAHSLSRRAN